MISLFLLMATLITSPVSIERRAASGGQSTTVLEGAPLSFRLDGLRPGATVILQSRFRIGDQFYGAEATYRTDSNGALDLERAAPVSGSYSGADIRGLFWAAEPIGKTSQTSPAAGEVLLAWRSEGRSGLETIRLLRRSADVVSVPVNGDGLNGWFAAPAGATARPVIIVLGGSEGGVGFARARAERLASEGWAALGLAYFSGSWAPMSEVPTHFEHLPIEALERARDWLSRRPEADIDRLGLLGASKGAEMALVAASTYDWVDAVVAYVPSDVVWQGFLPSDTAAGAGSSWSYQGEDLPFVPLTRWPEQGPYTDIHRESKAEAGDDAVAAARIPLERSHAALLLLGAEDDEVWPSADMVRSIVDRLKAAGYQRPVLASTYADVGHDLSGTGWRPVAAAPGVDRQAVSRAQSDAFVKSLSFLREVLAPDHRLIIQHVNVVPMTSPDVHPDRDVVVQGDRIVAITEGGATDVQPFDEVVDGRGNFLIPGLWDMHTHAIRSPEDALERVLPLYRAYGIVGVRDIGSAPGFLKSLLPRLADRPDLPELLGSGPVLDGPPRQWQSTNALPLEDVDAARAGVAQIAEEGASFAKIYTGLSAEQFDTIAQEAEVRRLPLVGHVPISLSLEYVSTRGLRSLEHATLDVFKDCLPSPNEAPRRLLNAWIAGGWEARFETFSTLYDARDKQACAALFSRLATRQVYFTPTLVNELRGSGWTETRDLTDLSARDLENCRSEIAAIDEAPIDVRERAYAQVEELTLDLHRAGIPLLAGTDVPTPCVSPGPSLHRELELMVGAGLSPWEALATATVNPARFLGRRDAGTLDVGQRADMVLLGSDPTANISAARDVRGVVLRGRWSSGKPIGKAAD